MNDFKIDFITKLAKTRRANSPFRDEISISYWKTIEVIIMIKS